MKEFCGYKSLDGSLHETEESCKKADYNHKVESIKLKFRVIDKVIEGWIKRYYLSTGPTGTSMNLVEQIVIHIFANHKQELLSIYKEGALMQKELDELKKDYDKSKWSSNWWLKFKWW